jgi:multiple sugar transport system ATP-binding protein
MAFIEGGLDPQGRFEADGFRYLPEDESRPAGRPAVLGVRPEHVEIHADGDFVGDVTLVEPMGNHQVVWLRRGNATLASLVHDGRHFAPGDRVAFAIDATRVSLFDPATGNRI